MEEKIRSLLKYPGGKFNLIDEIEVLLPKTKFNVYAEPFLGGASIAINLGVNFDQLLLNDGNSDVMQFWSVVKREPERLCSEIEELSKVRGQENYLLLRKALNIPVEDVIEPVKRAAIFYYLNREGFNGLVRYNSKGQFNVPYGKHKSFRLPDETDVKVISDILNHDTQLCALDWAVFFRDVVAAAAMDGKKIVMYVDPPYIPISKTASFTTYWQPFCVAEHEAMRIALDKLTSLGVKWILSNSKCADTERIFDGYKFHEVEARRNISCKGETRGKVSEYLITNY